ncbi:MAG: hypothetical protein GX777_05345 [Fastidiosipila sp.]|nr:hypothetical protein [Fastidiosipila sp.]
MGNAKAELEKPFVYELELKSITDELNALNIELNLDERDTSAVDAEPGQDDEINEKKCTDRER